MTKTRRKNKGNDVAEDEDSRKDKSEQTDELSDRVVKRDRSKQVNIGSEAEIITVPAKRRKGTKIDSPTVVGDGSQQENIFIQGDTKGAGQGGLTYCRRPFLG
jgi:hypothetical protein